jgi:hypothetical protein
MLLLVILGYVTIGCLWLLLVNLLVAIGGYSIGGYYWWLLMVIL